MAHISHRLGYVGRLDFHNIGYTQAAPPIPRLFKDRRDSCQAGGPPGAPIHRNSKAGWPIRPSVGRVGLFVSDLAPGSPYPPSLSPPAATLPLADNRLLVPRRYPIPAVVLGDDVLPALRARLRQELYIGVGLNSLDCFDTEVSLA